MQLEPFIPKHKTDLASAEAAVRAGYPAVEPILPDLISWLQDYNWPVAQILAPFLATIGTPMIPHIDSVFATSDDVWKYWMISCLIGESDALFSYYKHEMVRLANQPTEHEHQQELDEVARDAIEKRMSKS